VIGRQIDDYRLARKRGKKKVGHHQHSSTVISTAGERQDENMVVEREL
jgi:hypothetical protein